MPAKAKAPQPKQPSYEECIRQSEEMTRANQPLYDMLARMHAREEAEHAAVLTLRKKKQITKSDLVRIFDDHAKAIDKILERLDHSVDFAIMWSENTDAGRLPDESLNDDEEEQDDGGETKTAIAYELKKHGHFREHIMQHLRALRTEIMKI